MISDKILQTRLLLFLLVLSLSHLPLFAQKLTVESMQLLSNDVTAMTNQRQDLNGEYAGIVKVQLAVDGAKFEGNVIEQTKHETGEYWVWLAKDTKRMKIYAPGYLPLELNFYKSYDIKIEPKRTYQLVVASSSVVAPQSDNKGFLAFDVEPKNATLSIDGSKVGLLDGQYSNLVQQGSYEYEVTADGYESQRGRVQVTDQTQPVVVRLQSLMSTLLVSCATAGAEIYLDGQLRGKAPQTLTLLKGSHRVEARLEGYRSFSEDISVSEKESRRLDIPSLTRLTGSLRVNYMPLGSDVYVDGKKLGVTPSTFREVAVGNRKVEVRKDGYTTAQVNAIVKENETSDLSGNLSAVTTPSLNNIVSQRDNVIIPESSGGNIETFTVNGVSFRMVRVEGGSFMMGATSEQGSDAFSNEKPAHQVTLSSFSIGETEVTQELWKAVMGHTLSYHKGAKLPVERVTWDNCQDFIKNLNQLTGKKFRLPTEAEWEYAARGGSKSRDYKYSGGNDIDAVAWYSENSDHRTHEVGQKLPNELGLYDMSGNVVEWCNDWYGDYSTSNQTNPRGPSSGSYYVNRGGSCMKLRDCRVSSRNGSTPDSFSYLIGLRLALNYMPPGSDNYVDGNKHNVSFSTPHKFAVGSSNVEVSKDDYTPVSENALMKENETTDLAYNQTAVSTSTQNSNIGQNSKATTSDSSGISIETFRVNGVSFQMVRVEGGTFQMGSDAGIDEKPVHQVTLSSFSIGQYEVTQELWIAVMGNNPSKFNGTRLPVECVSWNDCQEFLRELNQLTGKNFRLPTEAEWEYAARGGSRSCDYKYSGGNDIGAVAWCHENSDHKTHEVGQKQPNELGLYDMSGNVYELCNDYHGDYSSSSQKDPKGSSSGSGRVIRGFSFFQYGSVCTVSGRNSVSPVQREDYVGLRLAL